MNTPTVLVVDDDVLVNIGTVDMIQDMGMRALEAYSGKEALDLLAGNAAVRVLITDYSMPGMNGIELASKALALRPDLHVVLATGYGELPGGEVTDLTAPRFFRYGRRASDLFSAGLRLPAGRRAWRRNNSHAHRSVPPGPGSRRR